MGVAKTFWFGVLVAFGTVMGASTDAQQRSGVRIEGKSKPAVARSQIRP